ncbi:MAG: TIGR01906 family membrane protein [Aerococcus sp.]|nr:TIGR01906 family membrane protein [Aerococcus sp.]
MTFLWALGAGVVGTLLISPALLAATLSATGEVTTLSWSLGTIMKNYWQLLAYLILPWTSTLNMSDFPTSPSAALHFMEVKHLFWLMFLIFVMASGILYFWLRWVHEEQHEWWLARSLRWVMSVPAIFVALLVALGFDRVFIGFHHLFFHNNAWLFDPTTDPIILVLTENFFLVCAVVVILIYEGGLWWLKRSLLKD